MAVVLPHNLTNNTKPDADQVMGNFNALLGNANGVKIVSGYGGPGQTARWDSNLSVRRKQDTLASSTITVAVNTLYKMDIVGYWALKTMETRSVGRGSLGVVLDGTPLGWTVGAGTSFVSDGGGFPTNYLSWDERCICGTAFGSLTPGTHTLAIQATSEVEYGQWAGGAWAEALFNSVSWTAIVIPQ